MVKFRTITDERDASRVLLPDAQCLKAFSGFLWARSLDELAELWNVIKGETSLFRLRPLLIKYLSLYSPEEAHRHEVHLGIIAWAQVNGRNAISWPEKFALDIWYVDHRRLLMDMRILWSTMRKVLARDDISAQGDVTMTQFTGSVTDKVVD